MKKTEKLIKLDFINKLTKKVYETSSEISLLQEELEDMLTAIDENVLEFRNGKISQEFFKSNERKLKSKSVSIIKKINRLIDVAVRLTEKIASEIESQKIKKK